MRVLSDDANWEAYNNIMFRFPLYFPYIPTFSLEIMISILFVPYVKKYVLSDILMVFLYGACLQKTCFLKENELA